VLEIFWQIIFHEEKASRKTRWSPIIITQLGHWWAMYNFSLKVSGVREHQTKRWNYTGKCHMFSG